MIGVDVFKNGSEILDQLVDDNCCFVPIIFVLVTILSFVFFYIVKSESNFDICKALGVSLIFELAGVPNEGKKKKSKC